MKLLSFGRTHLGVPVVKQDVCEAVRAYVCARKKERSLLATPCDGAAVLSKCTLWWQESISPGEEAGNKRLFCCCNTLLSSLSFYEAYLNLRWPQWLFNNRGLNFWCSGETPLLSLIFLFVGRTWHDVIWYVAVMPALHFIIPCYICAIFNSIHWIGLQWSDGEKDYIRMHCSNPSP